MPRATTQSLPHAGTSHSRSSSMKWFLINRGVRCKIQYFYNWESWAVAWNTRPFYDRAPGGFLARQLQRPPPGNTQVRNRFFLLAVRYTRKSNKHNKCIIHNKKNISILHVHSHMKVTIIYEDFNDNARIPAITIQNISIHHCYNKLLWNE